VTLRSNRRADGFTEAIQEHGYQGVRRGELVIHSMDGFAGAIGVSDSDGKMSPVAHIYRTSGAEARYLALLLRVMASEGFIESLGKGIRERSTAFDRATFKALSIPLPPEDEQRLILRYLDRETANIDAFIERNGRLIALLAERRASAIDLQVFGLLDQVGHERADIPEFVSQTAALIGVLRRIPGTWRIEKLKTLARRRFARNVDRAAVMRSLKVTGEIVSRASQQLPGDSSIPRYLLVEPDDLVVNPMWLTGGAIGVSTRAGAVSPDYRVFRLGPSAHPRFVHYLLRSRPYKEQYELFTRAETTFDRRVSQLDLDRLPIPLPPLEIQRGIAERLDAEIAVLDKMSNHAVRVVELARERRAALITAAVAGKIDVGASA
jgi:type I restriction enzyme S subunit